MKKYELTNNTIEWDGRTLNQIRALIDIPEKGVKAGDLGGWIQSEYNLSHDGNCWVGDNAKVWGNAKVHGNAKVCGNAKVHGNAKVYGSVRISKTAHIKSVSNWVSFGNVGSEGGTLTIYKGENNEIFCTRGCFSGTLEEFEKAVNQKHSGTKYEAEYQKCIELAKIRFGESKCT